MLSWTGHQRLIAEDDGAPHFIMRLFDVESGAARPHHTHPWEHEVFILEGQGVVRGGEREAPLTPGNAVFVPSEEVHQFVNTGPAVLRFLCLIPLSPSS